MADLIEVISDLDVSSWDDVKGPAPFGLETSGSHYFFISPWGWFLFCWS